MTFYSRRHRREFGCSPRKGTKLRAFLILLLRKQGVQMKEAEELTGTPAHNLAGYLVVLRDQKGWDIARFGEHAPFTYKVIGKHLANRKYRSLIGVP